MTSLPNFILAPFFKDERLVPLLSGLELPTLQLAAIYPRTRYLSLKVRLFTDFLLDWFADGET